MTAGMEKKKSPKFRFFFIALYLLFGTLGLFVWQFGTAFIGPFPYAQQPVPEDLAVEIIDFKDEAGTRLRGWFMAGDEGKGAVLLLHGLAGHKSKSLGRVHFLSQA